MASGSIPPKVAATFLVGEPGRRNATTALPPESALDPVLSEDYERITGGDRSRLSAELNAEFSDLADLIAKPVAAAGLIVRPAPAGHHGPPPCVSAGVTACTARGLTASAT
jgi:hypothetical protein